MTKPIPKIVTEPPDTLSQQEKEIMKLVLVQYLADNNLKAADVTFDADFAWKLVPGMMKYDASWGLIDSKAELAASNFFPDLI